MSEKMKGENGTKGDSGEFGIPTQVYDADWRDDIAIENEKGAKKEGDLDNTVIENKKGVEEESNLEIGGFELYENEIEHRNNAETEEGNERVKKWMEKHTKKLVSVMFTMEEMEKM